MNNKDNYVKAKEVVNEKIGLYTHATVFCIVQIIIAFINITTSPESLWFIWPLMGWGIGLLFHAANVLIFKGSKLFESMLENELQKDIYKS